MMFGPKTPEEAEKEERKQGRIDSISAAARDGKLPFRWDALETGLAISSLFDEKPSGESPKQHYGARTMAVASAAVRGQCSFLELNQLEILSGRGQYVLNAALEAAFPGITPPDLSKAPEPVAPKA